MTAARRGWCPTLDAPMQSGDGLLVRLRPPRGVLSASAARALAAAAAAFGNGVVELTQRAAVQVRGLRPETLAPFAAAMAAQGLVAPGPAPACAVLRAPLGEADALADAIESSLACVPGLPQKFCVAVEAGGPLPLGDVGADIRVAAEGASVRVGLAQTALVTRCRPDEAADAVAALARVAAARTPASRMRALVADVGAAAVFAAAGLTADAACPAAPSPDAVGRVAGGFGLGLPFGAFDAGALADLAETHGDGELRLTPWRAVVLAAVAAPDALAADAAGRGLITSPDDPRRRVFACPGAPACASATVATRPAALAWAALGRAGSVHVSGCAKGCAHPGPASVTLVGDGGSFSLVRDGRAGDAPDVAKLSLADAMAAA